VTYSIVAVDPVTRSFGVAVASKALCVGAHVPWGSDGLGAVATQAWHNLRYGYEGLELLENGCSAADLVATLTHDDPDAPFRQLGVVDADGRVASYTGSRCMPWAGGMCGPGYAVQGNLLAGSRVVEAMANEFEALKELSFPPRLVLALLAGDRAGGDRRGRQSAAVKIWRRGPAGNRLSTVDLRIDDSERPVDDLADMLPALWLDRGVPDPTTALTLENSTLEALTRLLPLSSADSVEAAIRLSARELNLEGRLLSGMVDSVLLDVLERGRDSVLTEVRSELPKRGWPTESI
jgi:uncharacterized Ntn-hydrolase superfamily protein